MAVTFAAMLEEQREQLTKRRDLFLARQRAIQDQLDGIDQEIEAIGAYETAKTGKRVHTTKSGRHHGMRDAVLALLQNKPMARKELLVALRVKGDKSGEQSVSNALANLSKAKELKRSPDRKYSVGAVMKRRRSAAKRKRRTGRR